MHDRRTHLDAVAAGTMVVLCAIWGVNQAAIKVANAGGISPVMGAGLRSVGAALLLWMWLAGRRQPLFGRDGTLGAGILAGIGFAGEFVLIYWGLAFTTASRGVVFLYMMPFVVAAGMHWLVPSERLSRVQAAGLVCAFAGIIAAFAEGLALPAGNQWIGDAMLLGAAVLWGGTTLMVRVTRLARVSAGKTLFYQLAVSAVLLPPLSLALGEPGLAAPTPLAWASLAFQTVVVAFASYLGWFWLITRYPATKLSAFSFLTPLFGMGFGAVLLGEPITPALMLAAVLVAAGIWLVNRRPS
ncbi:MAG: DMT family transporter [Magnetospirillum sp.]|nr:DMT family transporter [Magnetospirillum sp.]